MSERLLPSDDPVAEEVLEWTIEKDARDIAQIMHWLEQTNGRRDRMVLMSRAKDLIDEMLHAIRPAGALQGWAGTSRHSSSMAGHYFQSQ